MVEFRYLALPPSEASLFPDKSIVYSKFCMHPDYKRKIDCAGAAFEIFYKERILREVPKVEEEATKDEQDFENEHLKDWEKKRKKKTESELIMENLEDDLYHILGLSELGMGATLADIKSAYRRMALQYHPDKQTSTATDPMWLKVQKAYETLTDPDKKKKYDSTLKFDETIPEEAGDIEKFYETFGPVFQRNSIWSVKKNCPGIGNMNTTLREVYKFYDFWENFESWRDFTVFDEYNLDEAESRYEKRYMERENKKIKATHLKKERNRIKKLVDMAKNNDPRILKAKQEEEEMRIRKKEEQQMKKEKYKLELMEKQKKEEEEKLAKERQKDEEEKKEMDRKNKQQDDLKKAIRTLRTLMKEKVTSPQYDKFFLEALLESLKYPDIVFLNEMLEQTSVKEGVSAFEKFLQDFDNVKKGKKKELEQQTAKTKLAEQEEKKSKEIAWTVEELSQLSKALVKYPVGSKNRWECIATFLGTRSLDDVTQKAKELSTKQSLKSTASTITKDAFTQLQKQPGTMKPIDAEPDRRIVFGQTEEAPIVGVIELDVWTQAQQQSLEKALKEFPASLDPKERWEKISGAVGNKTKKQCVDRFKELRSAVLGNKK